MFKNLKINKIALLLIMVMAIFSACQKDVDEMENEIENTENATQTSFFQLQNEQGTNGSTGTLSEDDSLDMECFTFVYPITIVFPDGSNQAANSDDELEVIFETWFDQNPTGLEFPTFDFPLDVTLTDGSTQTVADEEALCLLLEDCWEIDDELEIELEDVFCFEIVYPVDIKLPDGSTQSADSDEALETIIFTWFTENPNSQEFPTFVYPIEVITEEGNQVLNNDDELEAQFEDCEDDYEIEECFTLNYPVDIIFPDNTNATLNSDEELETTIEDWYEQNPTSEEDPTFAYPIEVTLEDGTTQTINNDDELDDLFDTCFEDDCEANGESLLLGDKDTALTKRLLGQ